MEVQNTSVASSQQPTKNSKVTRLTETGEPLVSSSAHMDLNFLTRSPITGDYRMYLAQALVLNHKLATLAGNSLQTCPNMSHH